MASNKIWRLIIRRNLEPIRVQAIWHAVAQSISDSPNTNAILITTTNKPSLSCGYHQNFYEEVDLNFCKKNKIALVRRLAGGGLVLLDKNQVFYNVIMHGYGFPTPIKSLYRYALSGPNHFLQKLNLKSVINFNELSIQNRKISGTGAASIENSGVVIGNIILDFNYEMFCNALRVPNESYRQILRAEIEKYLTTLNKELEFSISIEEIITRLKISFEETVNTELKEDDLSISEIKILEDIEKEYKQENWNFRKRDDKNKIRSYIKIKKNTCLVHYSPFNSDFLISDEIIEKIHGFYQNQDLNRLIGKNIHDLNKISQDFNQLQEFLLDSFERSKI